MPRERSRPPCWTRIPSRRPLPSWSQSSDGYALAVLLPAERAFDQAFAGVLAPKGPHVGRADWPATGASREGPLRRLDAYHPPCPPGPCRPTAARSRASFRPNAPSAWHSPTSWHPRRTRRARRRGQRQVPRERVPSAARTLTANPCPPGPSRPTAAGSRSSFQPNAPSTWCSRPPGAERARVGRDGVAGRAGDGRPRVRPLLLPVLPGRVRRDPCGADAGGLGYR